MTPEQSEAYGAMRRARYAGLLVKEPCEVCGSLDSQGHHANGYGPGHELDLTWLCPRHHSEAHRISTWRARREALAMPIRELSRRSGVNRGTISRIERGWPAGPEDAAAILAALESAESAPRASEPTGPSEVKS
jgi:Helix-turn-helix